MSNRRDSTMNHEGTAKSLHNYNAFKQHFTSDFISITNIIIIYSVMLTSKLLNRIGISTTKKKKRR